jgi:hypothetical protein
MLAPSRSLESMVLTDHEGSQIARKGLPNNICVALRIKPFTTIPAAIKAR